MARRPGIGTAEEDATSAIAVPNRGSLAQGATANGGTGGERSAFFGGWVGWLKFGLCSDERGRYQGKPQTKKTKKPPPGSRSEILSCKHAGSDWTPHAQQPMTPQKSALLAMQKIFRG